MPGICDGRVVVVTGAGNGIGRAYALAFAAEGAKVVVNDLGSARDGSGASAGPAEAVVGEITAAGGEAFANTDDISTWDGAQRLIDQAIETYGALDVVVNNAGILRDKMLANMSEAEWDAVIQVHLKGTFAVSRHAAAYWRDRSKAGEQVDARIVNTTSPSGLFGNLGQTNYGAAKAGIATFSIIAAHELIRYGVTVNAIAPTALTRMTEDVAFVTNAATESEAADFDTLAPENITPLVVWLGSAQSRLVTGRVFSVCGARITVNEGWAGGPSVDRDHPWSPAELDAVIPALVAKAAPNANMLGVRDLRESAEPPAQMTSPRRFAERYVELTNKGQYSQLGTLFAEDAVFLGPGGRQLQGRNEIAAFYESFLPTLKPTLRIASFVEQGDECVYELEARINDDTDFKLSAIDHATLDVAGLVARFAVYTK